MTEASTVPQAPEEPHAVAELLARVTRLQVDQRGLEKNLRLSLATLDTRLVAALKILAQLEPYLPLLEQAAAMVDSPASRWAKRRGGGKGAHAVPKGG